MRTRRRLRVLRRARATRCTRRGTRALSLSIRVYYRHARKIRRLPKRRIEGIGLSACPSCCLVRGLRSALARRDRRLRRFASGLQLSADEVGDSVYVVCGSMII